VNSSLGNSQDKRPTAFVYGEFDANTQAAAKHGNVVAICLLLGVILVAAFYVKYRLARASSAYITENKPGGSISDRSPLIAESPLLNPVAVWHWSRSAVRPVTVF
jgi:hypothetical protein